MQVFEGSLPADLAVVWNPRLTATAGQVVDDGSRNHEKSSGAQRIPVRLELSSKVGHALTARVAICLHNFQVHLNASAAVVYRWDQLECSSAVMCIIGCSHQDSLCASQEVLASSPAHSSVSAFIFPHATALFFFCSVSCAALTCAGD